MHRLVLAAALGCVLAPSAHAQLGARPTAPARGVPLPTLPTLRTEGGHLALEPGVPFDWWTAPRRASARPATPAELRADSTARRACPEMPNASDTRPRSTDRMPNVLGDTRPVPMPVAAARCIARVD